MKGCYDGDECIQWHVCQPGNCKVRDQVERLRSQEHEEAPTYDPSRRYVGEATEVIIHGDEEHRIISNVEPDTMSYNVFEFRGDLSLTEEDIANLRNRFLEANNRVAEMWIPSLPPQVVADYEAHNAMTRTYPKHRCLICWLVSKLPGHHRCPHGRLVCEQCELEAGGW